MDQRLKRQRGIVADKRELEDHRLIKERGSEQLREMG
jgi:hypothetical protein